MVVRWQHCSHLSASDTLTSGWSWTRACPSLPPRWWWTRVTAVLGSHILSDKTPVLACHWNRANVWILLCKHNFGYVSSPRSPSVSMSVCHTCLDYWLLKFDFGICLFKVAAPGSSRIVNLWFQIWRPDVVLYNNVGDIIEVNTLLQVRYDGSITWLTQGIYTSKCDIDVKYYPMDAQNCSLKFASWSQEVTKVWIIIYDIKVKRDDLS